MRHLENKVGMNPATDRQTGRQTDIPQSERLPQTIVGGNRNGIRPTEIATTLTARDYKGVAIKE